jgi:hypothetical protein
MNVTAPRNRQESNQRDSFRQWYNRNATAYNQERQRRYSSDPDARIAAQLRASEYRERVRNGHVPKAKNGLYSTAFVALYLSVSTQTIRNWEAKGLIPKAIHGGKRRLYTWAQLLLLRNWRNAITNHIVPPSQVDAVISQLHEQWEHSTQ